MNAGGATVIRSILDKPLNQLTEDDISQLTREDCRRFLKDKGMRRPSWNKSQAIQQVISLKALLEPTDDDSPAPVSSAIHRHHHHHAQPPQVNLSEAAPVKGPDPDETGVRVQAVEDIQKSISPVADKPNETNDAPAGGCAPSGLFGQMTIFYCGKVNVYDGVSPDKAQSIMQLAASPSLFPQDSPLNKNAAVWASSCNIPIDKDVLYPTNTAILQVSHTDKMVEYPLQYREKGNTPRDAVKVHASNGNSSRSSTDSPPQTRLPLVSSGSADNQPKVALPIDLNDKDVQEC